MKALFTLATLFLLTTFCIAQAPQAFNYSAVVRNGSGNPIPNQLVKFRLNILRGSVSGTSVYAETHSTTTDANGMVNLEIGRGTIISGVFAAIPWNNDAFFFQVEVDPAGGNTFQLMGTTQFLSVPYALNAKYAENVAAQMGLFISSDTLHVFPGDATYAFFNGVLSQQAGSYEATIKWFGGNQEDFTYSVSNIPSGVTFVTPTNKAYNSSILNNTSEIRQPQCLSVSNSATPGRYTVTHKIITATNRVVQKNIVIHILSDCELVNYIMGKRFKLDMSFKCQITLSDTVLIVPNLLNPTCGIAFQFSNGNKLNMDINKGNLIISSSQNIGTFTTLQSPYIYTYQNLVFNAGTVIDAYRPTLLSPSITIPDISINSSYTASTTAPGQSCIGSIINNLQIRILP